MIKNFRIITDTPYLTLTGELWGAYCKYLWENWPHYNGTIHVYENYTLLHNQWSKIFFFTHIHFSFTSWQVQQQVHFELLESVCVIPILILGELFQSVMVPVGSILDAIFLSGEKLKITSLKWDISHRWLSKRLCISIGDTTGLQ